jgi:hypothetical protein
VLSVLIWITTGEADGRETMTRAERRAKAERAKERAKRQVRLMWGADLMPPSEKVVGQHAATPHNCSCYMCGNPRRFFREITFQEQKWNERVLMEEWPLER